LCIHGAAFHQSSTPARTRAMSRRSRGLPVSAAMRRRAAWRSRIHERRRAPAGLDSNELF
jgi:hypothetical protein